MFADNFVTSGENLESMIPSTNNKSISRSNDTIVIPDCEVEASLSDHSETGRNCIVTLVNIVVTMTEA